MTFSYIPSDIKAVLFDCDGTLVDTLPLYQRGLVEVMARLGHDLPEGWYKTRGGKGDNDLMNDLEAEIGHKLDREAVGISICRNVLERIHTLNEIKHIVDEARRLHGHYPMAVVSNGPRLVVEPSLESVGILRLFEHIVTSDDVQHPKPAPDMYLKAAALLNTSPRHCLVFEDSPEGQRAARGAGMRVIDVNEFYND